MNWNAFWIASGTTFVLIILVLATTFFHVMNIPLDDIGFLGLVALYAGFVWPVSLVVIAILSLFIGFVIARIKTLLS